MAKLPPDGEYAIEMKAGRVRVFNVRTWEEVVKFDPASVPDAAQAQLAIHESEKLVAEAKVFAHFWSGYFFAQANVGKELGI